MSFQAQGWCIKAMIRKKENGFTLVEILVAVIVLAIALTPIIVSITGALEQNTEIEKKTRTAFLAQKKLEEIKVRTTANFKANYSGTGTFESPNIDFRYRVVYPDPFNPLANIRSINIEVWYDQNRNGVFNAGEERTILYTKVAKRGAPG